MDTMILLAGVLFVGDVLLARIWWRERERRRKAERVGRAALRDNYQLMSALERRAAGRPRGGGPVVVEMPATAVQIDQAIAELKRRQATQAGGVA